MEFPTIDEFAKRVAEKALDEITYKGKTIREWAEIITKQQPCEDCISRAEALKHTHIEYDDDGVGHKVIYAEDIEDLPSVTPRTNLAETSQEWIPVTRSLPEEKGHYLVTTANRETCTAFWSSKNFMIHDLVIAWMELPDPYGGEKY